MPNLFTLPEPLPSEETFETLINSSGVHIERIISTGQTTPADQWYDQSEDEWVVLLQGDAVLSYEDGSSLPLTVGDYVLIPAHTRHRVAYTSQSPPCIWLAIHFSPGAQVLTP